MDKVGATVPYVLKSYNFWRTKNCVSLGLINLISIQLLCYYLIKKKYLGHLTTDIITLLT